MKIAIIDGQGGGIGRTLTEKIKERFGNRVMVQALGTNALATTLMLKAGADEGASGENAIVFNVPKADLIVGSIGIISANAMMGEMSPSMAKAISASPAKKLLIPLNRCNLHVTGVSNASINHHMNEILDLIEDELTSGHGA